MDFAELDRFAAQISLPEIGRRGQQRLGQACAVIVGVGGLGSAVAEFLAAAGVGHLRLIDPDAVDATNLGRQKLCTVDQIGWGKVEAARFNLSKSYPQCEVQGFLQSFNNLNVITGFSGPVVVLDCTDQFAARKLISDQVLISKLTYIFGSALKWDAQVGVMIPEAVPTWNDIFGSAEIEEGRCSEQGVSGIWTGLVAAVMSQQALWELSGTPAPLRGKLLCVDGRTWNCRVLGLQSESELAMEWHSIGPLELAGALMRGETVHLLDVREDSEREISVLPGDVHIPLGDIPTRWSELDKKQPWIVYCRSGKRSATVCAFLVQQGFTHVSNLEGGINGYAEEADPSLEIY